MNIIGEWIRWAGDVHTALAQGFYLVADIIDPNGAWKEFESHEDGYARVTTTWAAGEEGSSGEEAVIDMPTDTFETILNGGEGYWLTENGEWIPAKKVPE